MNRLIKKCLSALFAIALLPSAMQAGADNMTVMRVMDSNHGLSHNTVQCILQDSNGFMWFGTRDGLNRYDGSEMKRIQVHEDARPLNSNILTLFQSQSGLLFVGTSAGLCIYDSKSGMMERVPLIGPNGGVISKPISSFCETPDGAVWFPMDSDGVFRIDPDTREVTSITTIDFTNFKGGYDTTPRAYPLLSSSSPQWFITPSQLASDSSGRIYVLQADNNLFYTDDSFKSLTQCLFADTQRFAHDNIKDMACIGQDRIAFLFRNKAVICDLNDGVQGELSLPVAHCIIEGFDGRILIGTDEGMYICDGNLKVLSVMRSDLSDLSSLRDDAIYSLCIDRQGSLWAGSYFCGVHYLTGNPANIRNYFPKTNSEQLGQRIRNIVPDPDGTIWIGTEDRGVQNYDPATDKFTRIEMQIGTSNIQSILVDGDYLWIGTHSNNQLPLFKMDKRTGTRQYYPSATGEVTSLLRASDGRMYAGSNIGLMLYDEDSDSFIPFPEIRVAVNRIVDDGLDRLFVATNNGLYIMSKSTGKSVRCRYSSTDDSGLPSNQVNDICIDRLGRIWVATLYGGLCLFDPDSQSFRRFYDDGTVPVGSLFMITEGLDGSLWMTSNNGIVHFNPTSGQYNIYDSGFLCTQFNYNSMYMDPKGRVYAGTVKGLVAFDSVRMVEDKWNCPAVITEMSVTSRHRHSGDLVREVSLVGKKRVELQHYERDFVVTVSVPNFLYPEKNRIAYKLDGGSDAWHVSRAGRISFGRLRSGHHLLQVRGLDSKGMMDDEMSELSIVIHPHPLASRGMICLYALASILLIALIAKKTVSRIKEQKRRSEIEMEHDLYAAKFDFFTTVAHEIKTPLALISGPAQSLRRRVKDTDSMLYEDVESIVRNTDRLSTLVGQLLDFRKMETNGFGVNRTEENVAGVVKLIFDSFEYAARGKDYTLSLPDDPLVAAIDKELTTKLVSNLIFNALKYSDRMIKVALDFSEDKSMMYISVTNDGPVIPIEQRTHIFEPFVRFNETAPGTGLGLPIAKSLAERQGGALVMDDDFTVNRFIVSLPVIYMSHKTVMPVSEAVDEIQVHEPKPSEETNTRPSVLVVEDNTEMRRFISRQFEREFDIKVAGNGVEAMTVLSDSNVSVIVSDVMMPEMDGYELCRTVKNDIRFCHIPLMLLTAKGDEGSRLTGAYSGADSYMEKPFSVDLLVATVKGMVENQERIRRHFAESPDEDDTRGMSEYDRAFLAKVNAFMEENIDNSEIKVDDMASAVCMSSTSFFRKMKSLLGMTPNEYFQRGRLKRAAEMLREGSYTVADVSDTLGFSSHSYFSSCFKKQYGVSPKDYKASNDKISK
ncbi:MAG: response regulator [Bacteroidales bacterium]|nr:response regulator [Bacteroidales bacterium]